MTLLSEEIPFDTVMFLSNKSSAASALLRTAYLAGGDEFGSPTFRNIFLTMGKNYTNAIRYPASIWADLLDPISASRVRLGAWRHNIKTPLLRNHAKTASRGADCRRQKSNQQPAAERIVIPANIFVRPCTTARHAYNVFRNGILRALTQIRSYARTESVYYRWDTKLTTRFTGGTLPRN